MSDVAVASPKRKLLIAFLLLTATTMLACSLVTLYQIFKPSAAQKADCLAIITGTGDISSKEGAIQRLWGMMKVGDGECAEVAANLARIMDEREKTGADYGKDFGVVLWSLKILEDFSNDRKHVDVIDRVDRYHPPQDNADIGWKIIQSHAVLAKSGIILRYAQHTLDTLPSILTGP